jgi:hypothetical protein
MPPKINPQAIERLFKEKENVKDIDFETVDNNLLREEDDTVSEKEDIIFNTFKERGTVKDLSNFEDVEVIDFYQRALPIYAKARKRGPLPKYTLLDSIFLLLAFYKSGMDFPTLGALLAVKPATLQATISRVRPILLETLTEKWWNNRIRPTPLDDVPFPHAALLIDSTSLQVYRPTGLFGEAKAFFDGKNYIYAMKKEVAIQAAEPHYILFSQKGVAGAAHDYTIHKGATSSYDRYLMKTTEERLHPKLAGDMANGSWSMLLDKGYTGPASDTPGIPSNLSQEESNRI